MNKYALFAFILFGLISATPCGAEEIGKLSLDNTNSLATIIQTDPEIKTEGGGSVKITTAWPTVISLGGLSGFSIDNAKLVFTAKVKCQNLEGAAFLEMWCDVNGGQYFSRGMDSAVSGSMDWKTLSTPFLLKTGERADRVTLNIVINGKGTVWIDDVSLLKEPE